MKSLPERANWSRFPTTGQPGGPGGMLRDLDLLNREMMRTSVEMRKARSVKDTWDKKEEGL